MYWPGPVCVHSGARPGQEETWDPRKGRCRFSRLGLDCGEFDTAPPLSVAFTYLEPHVCAWIADKIKGGVGLGCWELLWEREMGSMATPPPSGHAQVLPAAQVIAALLTAVPKNARMTTVALDDRPVIQIIRAEC